MEQVALYPQASVSAKQSHPAVPHHARIHAHPLSKIQHKLRGDALQILDLDEAITAARALAVGILALEDGARQRLAHKRLDVLAVDGHCLAADFDALVREPLVQQPRQQLLRDRRRPVVLRRAVRRRGTCAAAAVVCGAAP